MAETFGSFTTPQDNSGKQGQFVEGKQPFKFKFNWRSFWIYGIFWCLVFVAIICIQHIGYTIYDQHRQIKDLINRLHQYDDPDFFDRDKVTPDNDEDDRGNTTLSTWVKQNLPGKGVEERPAVAEVFDNLADMLDDGTLQGEKDAFNEGISQLQPVATRRIWLPFLTKLTKKLKKQNLDNEKLSAAFRIISKSIDPSRKQASVLLLEGISPNSPSQPSEAESDQVIKEETKPSQNQAEEPETDKTVEKPETVGANRDCPNGRCQNQGYFWRYF